MKEAQCLHYYVFFLIIDCLHDHDKLVVLISQVLVGLSFNNEFINLGVHLVELLLKLTLEGCLGHMFVLMFYVTDILYQ